MTVFPFGNIGDAPDDYEVEDWAVGWFMVNGSRFMINGSLQGQPALARYEGDEVCELLVME